MARRVANAEQIRALVAKASTQVDNGKDASSTVRELRRELTAAGFAEVAAALRP